MRFLEMFSLHKNYIQEQQKLIHHLQEQVVEKNIQLNKMLGPLESNILFLPLFKQIAQLLAYYYPDQNVGANLIISILDNCETSKCDGQTLAKLENEIEQWEESLMSQQSNESQETKQPVTNESAKEEVTKSELKKEIENKIDESPAPPKVVENRSRQKKIVQDFGGLVLIEEEND